MKLAIPIWAERISPVLDEACRLLLVEIEDNKIINRKILNIARNPLSLKANYLQNNSVNLILCGAVSEAYIRNLSDIGIEVIPWLTGLVEEIISAYLNGILFNNNEFLMPGCCIRKRKRQGKKNKIYLQKREI